MSSAAGLGAGAARLALGGLLVLYPPLVWYALSRGSAQSGALWLLAVAVPLALLAQRRESVRVARILGAAPFATVGALVLAATLDRAEFLLLVPTAINAVFLLAFGVTLRPGAMPMVERFARLSLSDPSPEQLAWCRLWTWIWCAFFVANGTLAGLLALLAPLDVWAFYAGFLAYLLSGSLFAVEYLLRRRRFG